LIIIIFIYSVVRVVHVEKWRMQHLKVHAHMETWIANVVRIAKYVILYTYIHSTYIYIYIYIFHSINNLLISVVQDVHAQEHHVDVERNKKGKKNIFFNLEPCVLFFFISILFKKIIKSKITKEFYFFWKLFFEINIFNLLKSLIEVVNN
jgi:hypothetical protein